MLQAHADIDTVFAASDLMALGAIEAIAAAGKTGKIRVIGFDALDDAKKAIAAGTMEASVAQFPDEMGRVAVESAVKVMRGEPLPADIMVKLEMVTKANAHARTEARALTIDRHITEGSGSRRGKHADMARLNVGLIGRRPPRSRVRARPRRSHSGNAARGRGRSGRHAGQRCRRGVRRRRAPTPIRWRSSTTRASTRIVIVTPTHIHREQVIAAARARSRRSARSRRRCRSTKSPR